MLGAPLQLGALSVRLVRLWVNPALRICFVGEVFVGCLLYADDIVLLSQSCFGLRKPVTMCENFGAVWDIKFNPLNSQVATFGGNNPSDVEFSINGLPVPWVNGVKYLIDLRKSGRSDWSHNIRKFYSYYGSGEWEV